MKILTTLALRYLQGRKLRTFLTTLAITFGVMVIFGLNSAMPAITGAFQANSMAMVGQFDVTVTHKTGQAFPEPVAGTVAEVDGVRAVSASLERTVNLQPDYFDHDPAFPDRIPALNAVGVDPEIVQTVISYPLVDGRFLEPTDREAAVITQSLADEAGVSLGETLTMPSAAGTVDLVIVGILPQKITPGNEEVLVNLPEAQRIFDMPGLINVIEANFDLVSDAERAELEQAVIAALGPGFTVGVLPAGAEILTQISTGVIVINLLGVLALLMGGFIIFNTFRTQVAERRHDIGMLRSIGASRGAISKLFLIEGLVQGLVGTVVGVVLGYAMAWLIIRASLPVMQNFLNIQVQGPAFSPAILGITLAIGIGVTLLAGLVPARQASRVTPLEALRPAVGAVTVRRLAGFSFWAGLALVALAVGALLTQDAALLGLGSVLFVAGLLLVSPALVNPIASLFGSLFSRLFARDGTAQLAEGNLTRQPGRAAVTASTTMIALAILVMIASLISSLVLTFGRVLSESLKSDYLIIPPSVTTWGVNLGAQPSLAEDLRRVDGVEVVSTERFASTEINGVPVGLLGIEPYAYNQTSGLTFSQGDPDEAFRALEEGKGLIINGLLGTQAGLKLGDTVTLLTATGEAGYTVVGVASDFLNAKTNTAYVSQANIGVDFGRTEDVFFQVNVTQEADRTAVEAEIKDLLRPYPQFKLLSGAEYYEQNKGLLDSAFAGVYGMAIFLAIPSLIAMVNTLAIGVLERRREIGMLRAVGATRKQVRTVILAEALILAAIGTAFGLLAGLYLGYMATEAMTAIGFPLRYIFPVGGVLVAIAAGLLFGAFAAILPARQAANLQVVAALRYE